MFDPFTVSEAHQRAIQAEKQLARCPPLRRISPSPPSRPSSSASVDGDVSHSEPLEVDSEFVDGDTGPLLMLRHTFLSHRATPDDLVLRLHPTTGCALLFSSLLALLAALCTKAHPHPYKLAWLTRGTELLVSHRALVTLSVGPTYTNDIYCDVVPMDACHLLLGHPWQFDSAAFHDGCNNTYSFLFRGKKIVLMPRRDTLQPSVDVGVSLLSRASFKTTMSGMGIVYMLVATTPLAINEPPSLETKTRISTTPALSTDSICPASSCPLNINNGCTDELAVSGQNGAVVGCKSACLPFNQPQYGRVLWSTSYSKMFKLRRPQAYSFAYDDGISTFYLSHRGRQKTISLRFALKLDF
ncbi:hypothetical protein C2S51_034133 [Perilla frutescens var. frutescens]|nr:hypothetical protein C2S51_034133 [Perilla frutescens var. frutescens]